MKIFPIMKFDGISRMNSHASALKKKKIFRRMFTSLGQGLFNSFGIQINSYKYLFGVLAGVLRKPVSMSASYIQVNLLPALNLLEKTFVGYILEKLPYPRFPKFRTAEFLQENVIHSSMISQLPYLPLQAESSIY